MVILRKWILKNVKNNSNKVPNQLFNPNFQFYSHETIKANNFLMGLSYIVILISPCHLVLSVPGTPPTIMASLCYCFLSLSSTSFIPVTSCISSVHLLLGRPLLLIRSPHASILPFSNPSDRITCPKNPSFLLIAVYCSVSSSSIPI